MNSIKPKFPAGFITEQGSVYAYVDDKGTTQRFKVSASGKGQGNLQSAHTCLFIDADVATPYSQSDFEAHYIGFEINSAEGRKFKIIRNSAELPEGKEVVLVRKINGRHSVIPASFEPQIGTIPVEKWYNTDFTETTAHKGHRVSEIITSPERVLTRMQEAGKQFGHDKNYFSGIEQALTQAKQPAQPFFP